MMTRDDIELLAPAGDRQCLEAAVQAGADAIYLGGQQYGARAYAGNFSEEELLEALDYAHFHGRKIYLTVNTVMKEDELDGLEEYLIPLYEHGLDGVIVQDLGAMDLIHQSFPDMEIHGSTQMTITGVGGAKLIKSLGACRVVPARELNLREIAKIKVETKMDMECFVHGSLCYSYSGQCLMSSMIGGRSGNRGRCAGTCRLPFDVQDQQEKNQRYPFSLKDLCTIEVLPKLFEAGINSLKIEGRMKGPRYVGEVTRIYRKYIDLYCSGGPYQVQPKDKEILRDLFHRGGFTKGYYEQYHGPQMMSMEHPGNQGVLVGEIEQIHQGTISFHGKKALGKGDTLRVVLEEEEEIELTVPRPSKEGEYVTLNAQKLRKLHPGMTIYRMRNQELLTSIDQHQKEKIQENLKGKIIILKGECVKLCIDHGGEEVQVAGPVMEPAKHIGATKEEIHNLLCRTGTTDFAFSSLEVVLDDQLFVPGSVLKKLRREAFAQMTKRLIEGKYRSYTHEEGNDTPKPMTEVNQGQINEQQVVVALDNRKQLEQVLASPYVDCIYLPWEELIVQDQFHEMVQRIHQEDKQCVLILPQVMRQQQVKELEMYGEVLLQGDLDGLLVRNLEELYWLQDHGYQGMLIFDYMIYCYNRRAMVVCQSFHQGPSRFVYSVECNEKELQDLIPGGELFCYGRLPLMVSAQCVQDNLYGCTKKSQWLKIHQDTHKDFLVRTHCPSCYNEVYQGEPIWLGEEAKEMNALQPSALRVHLTNETSEEIQEVLQGIEEVRKGNMISLRQRVTKGHFDRGIL